MRLYHHTELRKSKKQKTFWIDYIQIISECLKNGDMKIISKYLNLSNLKYFTDKYIKTHKFIIPK